MIEEEIYLDKNKDLVFFENVGLRYDKDNEILKDVDLSVKSGDFYFILGESGAGKSTLLNLINMKIKPTRGFINILGKDVNAVGSSELVDIRRKIGMVFQDYKLIDYISIFDNIALPLRINRVDEDEIVKKVYEILEWIELDQYASVMPPVLSGGQKQRVAIARAVITNPCLLLADEPTGSVDSVMSNKIMEMFMDLNKSGMAIMIATHNIDLVAESNKKIILIQNNKVNVCNI
jgi:cell division transport system ATP-binding protein